MIFNVMKRLLILVSVIFTLSSCKGIIVLSDTVERLTLFIVFVLLLGVILIIYVPYVLEWFNGFKLRRKGKL